MTARDAEADDVTAAADCVVVVPSVAVDGAEVL